MPSEVLKRNFWFCSIDDPSAFGVVPTRDDGEVIAREAGFSGFTILPTEHENFRFYRLDP